MDDSHGYRFDQANSLALLSRLRKLEFEREQKSHDQRMFF